MAVPIIPLALAGAGAFAVWRGLFFEDKRHRSDARNGWQNEAFSAREAARRKSEEAQVRAEARKGNGKGGRGT